MPAAFTCAAMRLIVESRTYQLASDTTPANAADARLHSHYYPRRLPAEVLADAIAAAKRPVILAGHGVMLSGAEREVVELTVLCGAYIMHNRVFTALRVDLEPKSA